MGDRFRAAAARRTARRTPWRPPAWQIALSASPDDEGLVRAVAYLLIVSFAIALIRAWTLLGTRQFAGRQEKHQQSQPPG